MENNSSIVAEHPSSALHPQSLCRTGRALGTTLVTGSNGFVGSNVVAALAEQGVPTIAALRQGRQVPREIAGEAIAKVQTRRLDSDSRRLREMLKDVDTVIHVAGRVTAPNYRAFLATNYSLTYRLLAAAAKLPEPPRVILVSSVAAGGPAVMEMSGRKHTVRPRSAGDRPAPVSMYGRSKLAGERAAGSFADQVPITIVRPGIVFGPGDREVFQLVQIINRARLNLLPGYHSPRFPFVAVQDLVTCITAAGMTGRTLRPSREGASGQGIYYAADPNMISFAQFGSEISHALGQRWSFNLPIPIWLAYAAAAVAERLASGDKASTFNRDKIREARAPSWECEIAETVAELDWHPEPLTERIREAIAWYRKHAWL